MKHLLILFLLTFSACAQNIEQGEGWTDLKKSNFEIIYPTDWELNQSGQMGTNFVVMSPLESSDDTFRENVNLMIQHLPSSDIDLDTFIEISENQVETLITNGLIVKSERLIDKQFEFHHVIYTGKQGIYDLRFEQYCWVENGDAYILTFTSEQSQHKKYKVVGEKILESFMLKV